MGAVLGRIVNDYDGLIEICRQRAEELAISREGIDDLSGLADGLAGKLLGKRRRKNMGPTSLGPMLQALGLRLLIIEDEAATARTLALRTPVQSNQQRFGNVCRISKTLLPPSSTPASSPPPPPVSRAHLRVIQSKRRGKYG
jgi:hypothetical protein